MKGRERAFRLYRFLRCSLYLLFRLFYRFRVEGVEHIPDSGGFVVVANHVSFLDPPAVGGAVKTRLLRFVARDSLFEGPLGWMFKRIGSVALSRTRGDIAALKAVIKLLGDGWAVALFPEGTRSPDGRLQKAKPGIGFLVAKAEAPVIPAYIHGTFKALPRGAACPRPSRVQIRFGPPITADQFQAFGRDRAAYEKIGEFLMERILALAPESGR
jgi:1-acyl-sn-glycerol-3-phosphate acyltransferase